MKLLKDTCLLAVCGAINWDISCFVERLPAPGEEVPVRRVTRVSGGTGGNVAVAAARILGAGKVALIGALGEDDIARQQIATFAIEGVLTEGVQYLQGAESGQAYILVDRTGQNVIASYLGANAKLGIEHLRKPEVKEQLEQCRAITITDPPLSVVTEIIDLAKKRGVPLLWDPGILISQHPEAVRNLAKEVEVLFLNESEAEALLGGDTEAGLRCLKKLSFRNHVVLKLGAQGAMLFSLSSNVVMEIPALPVQQLGMEVVNTVGCGDAFAGAFAAYYLLSGDLKKSLIMASAAAGLNATRVETRGSPDRATLERAAEYSLKTGWVVREQRLS